MRKPSDRPPDGEETVPDRLREKLIGLGEHSVRKSYYPQLQQRLMELARFKALLDESKDAVFLVAVPSGRLIDLNRSACRELGWDRDELIGKPLAEVIDPSAGDWLAGFFAMASEGSVVRRTLVTRLRARDGADPPAEVCLSSRVFGDEVYAVAVARNVADRLASEAALKESETRYRRLFEESLVGNFITNAEGRIVDCNPAFARTFGYESASAARGSDVHLIYPSPEDRRRFLTRLEKSGRLEHHEMVMCHRTGRPLQVVINATADFDGNGRLLAVKGHIFDNTQRKELEAQFLQSQKMEAVGRLAAGVAHDFNNLMTAVRGYSQLIRLQTGADDPIREKADLIMEAVDRSTTMVDQLLSFSRKQSDHPMTIDLNYFLADMKKMLRQLLPEGIDLVIDAAPEPVRVVADHGRLSQVVMNLVVNARDAMPDGGRITIATSESGDSRATQNGRCGVLQVRDTGDGMDSEILAHLFEPFFTTKEKGKGTGLGLSTVYAIVRQSGGRIEVESEPGEGATFTIRLPQSADDRCGIRSSESPYTSPA